MHWYLSWKMIQKVDEKHFLLEDVATLRQWEALLHCEHSRPGIHLKVFVSVCELMLQSSCPAHTVWMPAANEVLHSKVAWESGWLLQAAAWATEMYSTSIIPGYTFARRFHWENITLAACQLKTWLLLETQTYLNISWESCVVCVCVWSQESWLYLNLRAFAKKR